MKTIWQLFKKHPVAIIFYLIYLSIFIASVMRELEYKRIIKENGGKWPYGVREWDGVLLFLFAFIFFVISCAYAIGAKENKFYLWLILAIIIPMWVFPNI